MADGFGADKGVIDITAPQVVGAFDIERAGLRRADQGLGGQQVQLAACVFVRIVTAAELEPQDLRQPARQGEVGLDFVPGRALSRGVSDDQFVAIRRGHAFPLAIPPCVWGDGCRDQAKGQL